MLFLVNLLFNAIQRLVYHVQQIVPVVIVIQHHMPTCVTVNLVISGMGNVV